MTQADGLAQPLSSDDREKRFVLGDEQALREMIDEYGQPLLRYCHGILCDYYEAQDAVQVTFLKAYSRRDRYRLGTNLGSWLYRIAYTTCVDLLRRKKLRQALPLPAPPTTRESGISEELRTALLSLKAADRALLWSRAVEETPYEQLEPLYHLPAATLRKRYERAKEKLAARLNPNETEGD